jgi:ADP-ribose pyrophosphatase YjhB (NUDIX family)
MTPRETDAPVVDRVGARVLLVDALERVLLMRGVDPADPQARPWWITPGGGVDPGESVEEGARRELAEETGLRVAALGGPVWLRTVEFDFLGHHVRQAETFFLLRVERHEVDRSGWTDVERAVVQETRWWGLDELATTADDVYPRALARELRRLLDDGVPASPYRVGE